MYFLFEASVVLISNLTCNKTANRIARNAVQYYGDLKYLSSLLHAHLNIVLSRVGIGHICLRHVTQETRVVRQGPDQYCIKGSVT